MSNSTNRYSEVLLSSKTGDTGLRPEVIRVEGRYYVLASSSLADSRTRVLKQGDTFAVFDRYGDVHSIGASPHGIFHRSTRYLSRLELKINGVRPLLLSSSVLKDDTLLAVDLTNPDILRNGDRIPRDMLHVFRSKFLQNGTCFERFRVTNYADIPIKAALSFSVGADFMDIFEVRGTKRKKRGALMRTERGPSHVLFSYKGLDGVVRRMRLEWDRNSVWTVQRASKSDLVFRSVIQARLSIPFHLRWHCLAGDERPVRLISHDKAYEATIHGQANLCPSECTIETGNDQFNSWLNRSHADIRMMMTRLPRGCYPYAGVPWYNTVFGRDGIWTALFYLWMAPGLARGVLAHLAALQSTVQDPARDAEPGKILHETREGEMAALGEIPFGLYYGSIDATPLFVMLAGAYLDRTGDMDFIRSLWPNIQRALDWMVHFGDIDGDGFIEYSSRSKQGLVNQGWKDSGDSIFHENGSFATGPIALCEVQGYAFDAWKKAAAMAHRLDRPREARDFDARAILLQDRFERHFWSDRLGTYCLALDGAKQQCAVRTSNVGHLLFSGIATTTRAWRTTQVLMSPDMFSGWGIRTLAKREVLYNPMSYHNGSVWPHDNAITACGMARYGHKNMALQVIRSLFDASVFMDLNRLPELFCGFDRRPGEGPTLYPVACSPQAWSAAAPFFLLQSVLGLSVDGMRGRIVFDHPVLPDFLKEVHIRDLSAGSSGKVDVLLTRYERDVGVDVIHRDGPVEVMVTK